MKKLKKKGQEDALWRIFIKMTNKTKDTERLDIAKRTILNTLDNFREFDGCSHALNEKHHVKYLELSKSLGIDTSSTDDLVSNQIKLFKTHYLGGRR